MDISGFLKSNRKIIIYISVAAAVYLVFKYLLPLFMPFVIAYLLALLIKRPVMFLYRKLHIKPLLSGAVLTILMTTVLASGLYFLLRALILQLVGLAGELPNYIFEAEQELISICSRCDGMFGLPDGAVHGAVVRTIDSAAASVRDGIAENLTGNSLKVITVIGGVGGFILIVLIAVILIVRDIALQDCRNGGEKHSIYPWLERVRKSLADAGASYLKVQGILFLIIATVLCIGLFIIENPYALLIGIGIAVMDALPVLGSGLVLVPWAAVRLMAGEYRTAAVLLIMFIICQIIRDLVEPRLLGDKIGVNAVYALMAMYAGVRLLGPAGFLLGPIGLLIIKNAAEAILDSGESAAK